MPLGMIGLGRMGGTMVGRVMKHGHARVVNDHGPAKVRSSEAQGAVGALRSTISSRGSNPRAPHG
jgi:6-phosphogluconate dehydrogenase